MKLGEIIQNHLQLVEDGRLSCVVQTHYDDFVLCRKGLQVFVVFPLERILIWSCVIEFEGSVRHTEIRQGHVRDRGVLSRIKMVLLHHHIAVITL